MIVGCVILSPRTAIGRLIPLYHVIKAPPTSSPTSTPSYQPSGRPSSQPTASQSLSPSSSPSFLPSIAPSSRPSPLPSLSFPPSLQPSSRPSLRPSASLQPTYSPSPQPTAPASFSSQLLQTLAENSIFGIWEMISITLIGILFCVTCFVFYLVRKQNTVVRVITLEEEEDGWPPWMPSFWLGGNSWDE